MATAMDVQTPTGLTSEGPPRNVLDDGQRATLPDAQLLANRPLRANIDETVLPVIISEQGENRDQCEEQRNIFDFSQGFACR